jgi:Ca-activated chloride channel family protein
VDNIFNITFARPNALWLLLLVPLIALLTVLLRNRRRVGRPVLALRLLIIALIALTLAEPMTTQGAGAVSTVFVVDRSRSLTDSTQAQINDWINDALQQGGSEDRAAVVSFAAAPELTGPAAPANQMTSTWDQVSNTFDTNYTDIESALALARALPLGGSRRIVLVSDGAENIGSALNQSGQAATDRTPIDVLPVEGVGDGDLRVESATAPSTTWVGERVTVVASIATGAGGDGTVDLLVDGSSVASKQETFPTGLSSYSFEVKDLKPGFHSMEVRVTGSTANDRFQENNSAPLSIVVRDQPKLLLVAQPGTDVGLLKGSLERGGAVVTVSDPTAVPSRLSELGVYDAIILNNIPASAMTLDQLAGLQEATRSLGRGLIVIGGTSSYGPGNYAGTILEDTLPVTVKVTEGKERQRVALLLIIDKSGSMSYDPLSGTPKVEMAKEAAKLAASALSDGDQIGVIAFSDSQQIVVPITTIDGQATRDEINAKIDGIKADGGTEIYPALSLGFDAIRSVNADVRHIVLLSDGKSRSGTLESYEKLISDAITDRTTLSTIAIGDDADTELLQTLAEQGNGRYHFTEKSEDIPQLTLAEAQSAGSQSVLRGEFKPIQSQPSPILTGFKPQELPVIQGYDYAQPKPDAQVVLTSERDDPILAKWQYGLGRVVAWTADDGSDFAIDWQSWPRVDEFWASMVRWSLPDPENQPLQVSMKRDGREVVITVDAMTEDSAYVDSAPTTATVTAPGGAVTKDLPLYQVGPGQYQVRVLAPDPGAYRIDLTQQRGDQTISELAGFAIPPSPELQPSQNGEQLLEALAARTGGRVLSLDGSSEAFTGAGLQGTSLRSFHPVWFVPLTLALILFLTELILRFDFLPRLRALSFRRRPA